MKAVFLTIMLVAICMVTGTVLAQDMSDWERVDVDESQINSSSTTVFSVLVPPGNTLTTIDSPMGAISTVVNESDSLHHFIIYIIDNPLNELLTVETSQVFMDSFMEGANITPLAGMDPVVLSDGIVNYAMQGEQATGVFVLSNDEKIIIVAGYYSSLDDAIAGATELTIFASTVTVNPGEESAKQPAQQPTEEPMEEPVDEKVLGSVEEPEEPVLK